MMKEYSSPGRQDGVALLMALMFLVIITLIALSSMRTSTLELKMAGNEQLQVEAAQSAQSAIDTVIQTNNFQVTTDFTACFNKDTDGDGNGCELVANLDLDGDGVDDNENEVEINLVDSGSFTCRACQSSANQFNAAQFSILSDYADTTHGGRAQIGQGILMLIPTGN